MSGADRGGTASAGAEGRTPHTSTGTSTPINRGSMRFYVVVFALLGAYLVLYAISPALPVFVIMVVGLVALISKLAKAERAGPNRRDWTNRETALFLAT